MRLLANFAEWEKDWLRSQMVYKVKGHNLESIKSTLESVGFIDVNVKTIDGNQNVDSNHSAYFICRKPEKK